MNDIETISEDILAIQLEKSKSRDNLKSPAEQGNLNNQDNSDKKPYRSEMNLYLQYDAAANPTISNGTASTTQTGSTVLAASSASDSSSGHKLSSRTRSLEREPTDSPAPHMPDPMAPFPDKCTYLGFEQLNQAVASGQKPPVAAKPSIPAKPPPPLPPARRPAMPTEPQPQPPPSPVPQPVGMSPNKSHLYKSLATAAAKRAIFRSTPTQLTRSLDVEPTTDAVDAVDPVAASEVSYAALKIKPIRIIYFLFPWAG